VNEKTHSIIINQIQTPTKTKKKCYKWISKR